MPAVLLYLVLINIKTVFPTKYSHPVTEILYLFLMRFIKLMKVVSA